MEPSYYTTGWEFFSNLLTAVVFLVSGGGFVAIVNVLANRNKNRSEVTEINVQTAIELERVAMKRYTELRQRLSNMEFLLDNFRLELDDYRAYVTTLQNLLNIHGVDYPEMSKATSELFSE